MTDGDLTTSRKSVSAPSEAGTITLYKNGESQGTQTDLTTAFSSIPESGSDTYLITLASGTYNVTGLTVKTSNSITIKGLGSAGYGLDVLIYGQGSDMSQESLRSTLSFQGTCNVVLENLTVQNSYGTTTGTAQAETLGVGPTAFSGTLAAFNCSFLSGQDTICTEGKAWFYKCYVEGDVDFLWIETYSSKVALYEECVIRAIDSRTTKAYFAAPRLKVANTVGKGVVIFNSTLEAESGLKNVYLGRNPWDTESDEKKGTSYFDDYYENIAIVGTKYYGPALNEEIWSGSGAHGTANQQFVGFKTDSHFKASSIADTNGSARLTDDQVSSEYSDRNVILNRVYNISDEAFENDSASSIWDVSSLESEFSAGSSGELEEDTSKVEYSFTTLTGYTAQKSPVSSVSPVGSTSTALKYNFAALTGYSENDAVSSASPNGTSSTIIKYNFTGLSGDSITSASATSGSGDAITFTGTWKYKDTTYGIYSSSGSSWGITVPVTGACIITITNSFSTAATVTLPDNVSGSTTLAGSSTTTYTYSGTSSASLTFTLAASNSIYISEVDVKYGAESDLTLSNWKWHGSTYGLTNINSSSASTITIPVTGACIITITNSYKNSANVTLPDNVSGSTTLTANSTTTYTYSGTSSASLTFTLAASDSIYISEVDVKYGAESDLTLSNWKWHGSTYGLTNINSSSASTITIPVTGACTIAITNSYTEGSPTVTLPENVTGNTTLAANTTETYTYSGTSSANLTFSLTASGSFYISGIIVKYK